MKATVKITKSVAATATLDGAISATVNAHATSTSANLQSEKALSITPTEEAVSAVVTPDSGYDGLREVDVTVSAIPDDFVGSAVPRKTSADLTASGATVTAPSGYYAEDASKAIPNGAFHSGGYLTRNPSISVASDGTITASVSGGSNLFPIKTSGYLTTDKYFPITVTGSSTSSLSTEEGKTVTPTESEQTAVAAEKFTTGDVKVGAIPSNYVGSSVPQNDSTDLTVSGDTVTAPSGYYASSASASVASGSATTPTTTITANPSVSVNASGLVSSSVSASQSVTPIVSEGYVTSGTSGTVSVSGSNTLQLTTQSGSTITPTSSVQTAVPSGTFVTGDVKVDAVPDAVYTQSLDQRKAYSGSDTFWRVRPVVNVSTAGNIPTGEVVGSSGASYYYLDATTVTPSESTQTIGGNAWYMGGAVTVNPIPSQYIIPTGTVSITSNGTGIDVSQYATADVSVSGAIALVPYAIRPDAEKWKTYNIDKKFVNDGVISSLPSYSTSAQTILNSSQLEALTIDHTAYDYWVTMRFLATPIYNTSTIAKGRNEYWVAAYQYECVSIPPDTFETQGGKNYATRVNAIPQAGAFYRLFYWSSTSAVTVYNTATYGFYMTVTAPTITSSTLTIMAPAFGVRGHNTYLSSSVYSTITDIRYQYVIDVYRAPKGNLNIDGWSTLQDITQTINCAKSSTGKLT